MACHFMDIYRGKKHDKKHDKKLPIMFNLHGGGFLLGKKEESHLFCAEMSQKGFLVFSLEYPLAPESLFPQILRDLMKGIKNSRVYFQKYNGDEERIYLTGTSAGASLCVYLAAMMQSPELADVFGVVPADLGIRAMGLASGMYYTTKWTASEFFFLPVFTEKGGRKVPFIHT